MASGPSTEDKHYLFIILFIFSVVINQNGISVFHPIETGNSNI